MKLTLNRIKERHPSPHAMGILLKLLNKTKPDNEEFNLIRVLESNGIDNALWCLGCFDYLNVCLFLADVAESVLPIYEAKGKSKAPRKCIQAIRDYKAGIITHHTLEVFRQRAYDAAITTCSTYSTYSDFAAAAISSAADAEIVNAVDAISSAVKAVRAIDGVDAQQAKWDEIETLFVKRFGGDE